jgi:hypothetical protein
MSMSQVGVTLKTEEKPVVHYILNEDSLVALGAAAEVEAVDHPRLGHQEVRTSRVIRVEPNTGIFETLNTVYTPLEQLNG